MCGVSSGVILRAVAYVRSSPFARNLGDGDGSAIAPK
jgi:hypothetical protein